MVMTAKLVVVNLQSERKGHKPLPVYRFSKTIHKGGKLWMNIENYTQTTKN